MSESKSYRIPDERLKEVIAATPKVIVEQLTDDGAVPNNPDLPLLIYQGVLSLPRANPGKVVQELFDLNRWGGSWVNGVFSYQHYHSTAHEVLAVVGGEARILFGGESGPTLSVEGGDVAIFGSPSIR